MKAFRTAVWVAVLAVAAGMAAAAVKPIVRDLNLPEIWQKATPSERLMAVRAAELDATRLLMERVYGLQLDGDTYVADLVAQEDSLRGELSQALAGVSTTEQPEYLPDGRVQVVRAVTLRQVIETVTSTIKQRPILMKQVTVESSTKVERENVDTKIDVMGNAGLAGSEGLRKIQAKRAAEMDAYRNLAERIKGVHINATTSIKNLMLESDLMRARVSVEIIKGAKPAEPDGIVYFDDASCEVTMQIKLADIFRVVKVTSKSLPGGKEVVIDSTIETSTQTITAKGRGAPRAKDDAADMNKQAAVPVMDSFKIVTKTLIGQGVVIE